MASPLPPRVPTEASGSVKSEDGDAQSVVSNASSETAHAAPLPAPDSSQTVGGKRSAPSSPSQTADGEANDSTTALDSGPAKPADETTADEPDEATPPPAKRRTMCGVCFAEPSKYKCSRCALAYCSVACSRTHRENHPPDAPADSETSTSTLPPASTVPSLPPKPAPPRHPFQVLDDAPELRRLFAKYPNLPTRLRSIYEATLPPGNGPSNGAQDPRLPARPNQKNTKNNGGKGPMGSANVNNFNTSNTLSKPWSKETGLRQGQKALRRARVDPGEDGDAVRAYCETVTFLLARDADGAAAATTSQALDTDSMVRNELAMDANELIQRLMDAEGRK